MRSIKRTIKNEDKKSLFISSSNSKKITGESTVFNKIRSIRLDSFNHQFHYYRERFIRGIEKNVPAQLNNINDYSFKSFIRYNGLELLLYTLSTHNSSSSYQRITILLLNNIIARLYYVIYESKYPDCLGEKFALNYLIHNTDYNILNIYLYILIKTNGISIHNIIYLSIKLLAYMSNDILYQLGFLKPSKFTTLKTDLTNLNEAENKPKLSGKQAVIIEEEYKIEHILHGTEIDDLSDNEDDSLLNTIYKYSIIDIVNNNTSNEPVYLSYFLSIISHNYDHKNVNILYCSDIIYRLITHTCSDGSTQVGLGQGLALGQSLGQYIARIPLVNITLIYTYFENIHKRHKDAGVNDLLEYFDLLQRSGKATTNNNTNNNNTTNSNTIRPISTTTTIGKLLPIPVHGAGLKPIKKPVGGSGSGGGGGGWADTITLHWGCVRSILAATCAMNNNTTTAASTAAASNITAGHLSDSSGHSYDDISPILSAYTSLLSALSSLINASHPTQQLLAGTYLDTDSDSIAILSTALNIYTNLSAMQSGHIPHTSPQPQQHQQQQLEEINRYPHDDTTHQHTHFATSTTATPHTICVRSGQSTQAVSGVI